MVTEPVERAQDIRADLFSGYPVFLAGDDSWLHELHHSTTGRKRKIPSIEEVIHTPRLGKVPGLRVAHPGSFLSAAPQP
jgi:hypothetical protein